MYKSTGKQKLAKQNHVVLLANYIYIYIYIYIYNAHNNYTCLVIEIIYVDVNTFVF